MRGQHEIIRLDVAVNDCFRMQKQNRGKDLLLPMGRLPLLEELFSFFQLVPKITALAVSGGSRAVILGTSWLAGSLSNVHV